MKSSWLIRAAMLAVILPGATAFCQDAAETNFNSSLNTLIPAVRQEGTGMQNAFKIEAAARVEKIDPCSMNTALNNVRFNFTAGSMSMDLAFEGCYVENLSRDGNVVTPKALRRYASESQPGYEVWLYADSEYNSNRAAIRIGNGNPAEDYDHFGWVDGANFPIGQILAYEHTFHGVTIRGLTGILTQLSTR